MENRIGKKGFGKIDSNGSLSAMRHCYPIRRELLKNYPTLRMEATLDPKP